MNSIKRIYMISIKAMTPLQGDKNKILLRFEKQGQWYWIKMPVDC